MKLVTHGAELRCNKGSAPCGIVVAPRIGEVRGAAVATVDDHLPANVPGFAACSSPTNPAVATATAAAGGALTPQPCIPSLPSPWTGGSEVVEVTGRPGLLTTSKCACAWGGEIAARAVGEEVDVTG